MVIAVVVLAHTAGLPLWPVDVISIGVRVTAHLYLGVPAIGMTILGAASVWLYQRYQRLLPLFFVHLLFDTVAVIRGALC